MLGTDPPTSVWAAAGAAASSSDDRTARASDLIGAPS